MEFGRKYIVVGGEGFTGYNGSFLVTSIEALEVCDSVDEASSKYSKYVDKYGLVDTIAIDYSLINSIVKITCKKSK
jgi:hypothetical protein